MHVHSRNLVDAYTYLRNIVTWWLELAHRHQLKSAGRVQMQAVLVPIDSNAYDKASWSRWELLLKHSWTINKQRNQIMTLNIFVIRDSTSMFACLHECL